VKVRFKADGFRLGYLRGNGIEESINPNISVGNVVETPLWLTELLVKRNFVDPMTPALLQKKYQDRIRAGSAGLNLRLTAPHFYWMMRKMAELFRREAVDVVPAEEVLSARLPQILGDSQSCFLEDKAKYTRKLSFEERRLFDISNFSSEDYDKWRKRSPDSLGHPQYLKRRKRS
jgi:hypothetical protein